MKSCPIESLEPRRQFADVTLTAADVQQILAQAASQVTNPSTSLQAFVVTDREGNTLGQLAMGGLNQPTKRSAKLRTEVTLLAAIRARTVSYFESNEDAFTTRTARFIIQDHFPPNINFTPGGPLYGVEFSSLINSDIVGFKVDDQGNPILDSARNPIPNASGSVVTPAISGDPGGIPLFKDGVAVGGIGVAGDGSDTAARATLINQLIAAAPTYYGTNPKRFKVFADKEESDRDEQLALAGAQGFMASSIITADRVLIDGIRTPFTKDKPASGQPLRSLSQITAARDGLVTLTPIDTPALPYPVASYGGVKGFLKNNTRSDFGIVSSDDTRGGTLLPDTQRLTKADVRRIFADAAKQALNTRAGIRQPVGVPAQVHIAVVDRDGDVLGVFKMADGTNFSFDVAVQKARTAAFFSDNTHAFSARAIGFMSQNFFPPGIDYGNGEVGPLYQLQDALSPGIPPIYNAAGNVTNSPSALALNRFVGKGKNPLKNGITVFPGGIPLYKNGKFVGAIGISGDGVDQDDLISYGGAKRFQPSQEIRSDFLDDKEIATFITGRVERIKQLFNIDTSIYPDDRIDTLEEQLDFRLPYVKFPRNPNTQ